MSKNTRAILLDAIGELELDLEKDVLTEEDLREMETNFLRMEASHEYALAVEGGIKR